ncbi:GreA/GreB family elongation factor [Streptomyces sp. NBC_01255]|uniref:GreA/GreB family elongation factor n=1 Tax=Streptomyces sp. NBC_01255 TaxID=2903798 RepID=UPI002E3718C4|nr:GreA/GreB family elongation factor [Streptomyces sp. NBC_01255]
MTGGPEPLSAITRAAFERELADLRAERETVAVTLRDGGGDQVGDRADQADELQRVTELQRLDARITDIDARLREGSVAGPPNTDEVGVGSSVTVRFADGVETTVQIGEVAEVLDATMVTADSPLGRALLGHRAGDTVTYDTPEGRTSAVVLALGDANGDG